MKLNCTYCKTELNQEKIWYDIERLTPYCNSGCRNLDSASNCKIISASLVDKTKFIKIKKGKLEKKIENGEKSL